LTEHAEVEVMQSALTDLLHVLAIRATQAHSSVANEQQLTNTLKYETWTSWYQTGKTILDFN